MIVFFSSKGWGWCLNDQPAIDLQPKLPRPLLPGERFDADAQCKVFFGAKSTICNDAEVTLKYLISKFYNANLANVRTFDTLFAPNYNENNALSWTSQSYPV